mmetsp:Transcript_80328/g.98368  ORF Transcript_80328/g.98368 Transcript_80328/m.98368 type:complete len:96 (-) Transcript_80328:88-375(-)
MAKVAQTQTGKLNIRVNTIYNKYIKISIDADKLGSHLFDELQVSNEHTIINGLNYKKIKKDQELSEQIKDGATLHVIPIPRSSCAGNNKCDLNKK